MDDDLGSDQSPRTHLYFICLCELTKILGKALKMVYDIRKLPDEQLFISQQQDLEQKLESYRYTRGSYSMDSRHPGGRNLELSEQALRLLLARLNLQFAHASQNTVRIQEAWNSCEFRATTMFTLLKSFERSDFGAWMLPYVAYHITSAVSLLLRVALETSGIDRSRAQSCFSKAGDFVWLMRQAKDNFDWDLAEICLTQCENVVERLRNLFHHENNANLHSGGPDVRSPKAEDLPQIPSPYNPLRDPAMGLTETDALFPDLWDMFDLDRVVHTW
jgi:hypothetical protein